MCKQYFRLLEAVPFASIIIKQRHVPRTAERSRPPRILKSINQYQTHLVRYPSCPNSLLAAFNYMDSFSTKRSTSTSRNKPPSRPSTPLRPSSRTSIRDSQTITPKNGPTAFPLESLEPAFAEFADSMADLEANFMHLQLMHESLSRFNESFASFLYGMNMNAFCVDFPEVRGVSSRECSGTEAS